jgi:hypothetical protein
MGIPIPGPAESFLLPMLDYEALQPALYVDLTVENSSATSP